MAKRTAGRRTGPDEVFYIVNWPYHEHSKMNELKNINWVKAKLEWGEDWIKIMERDERADAILAWEIVRGLAAQSPYRGMLLREGHRIEPHTVRTMAMATAAPEAQLRRGLGVLEADVGWVRRRRWRGSPRAMSRRIYGQVFSKFDVSGRQSGADSAPVARQSRASSAPSHSPLHSRSQGSELINPPNPPRGDCGMRNAECGTNEGEEDFGWGNGSWRVIEDLAKKKYIEPGYLPWMRKRSADLAAWPFKDVVTHFVDVTKGRKRPKSMDQVFAWVFFRLREGKAPSVKNRRTVERFLRYS